MFTGFNNFNSVILFHGLFTNKKPIFFNKETKFYIKSVLVKGLILINTNIFNN